MRVVFYSEGDSRQIWEKSFQQYLPNLELEDWETAPAGADYAIAWKPPVRLFEKQTSLKAMFALGAGVDALLPFCPPSLPLYRLENSGMAEQMADYVTRMLLDWFYYDAQYRQQQQKSIWHPHQLLNKQDWPVCVLGLGQLGAVVAKRCQTLGFPVIGWRNQNIPVDGIETVYGQDGLTKALSRSKVLVNLLPLTTDTENILSKTLFSQMPKGSYLINIARGAQLVEKDLLEALENGQLSGAALDVFKTEPLPANHIFWSHTKIRVTPHIAGITPMQDAVAQIAAKLTLVLEGKSPSGLVDRTKGY